MTPAGLLGHSSTRVEHLVNLLQHWVALWVDFVVGVVSTVVGWLAWPAEVTGIPPEILGAVILCAILLALWRAMGGYFT